MDDKPSLDGPSEKMDDRSFDISASHPTLALFKPQAPHERSESGGKIDKGFVILRALFDH